MKSIGIVVAVWLALALIACSTAMGKTPLRLRELAQGFQGGVREARQEVLTSGAEWSALWRQHAARQVPHPPAPRVDFDKEMVIAVTMGGQRSGGYKIEIVEARVTDENLVISVRKTAPPPGAFVTMALTSPFHFVAVPKSDLKPVFVGAE